MTNMSDKRKKAKLALQNAQVQTSRIPNAITNKQIDKTAFASIKNHKISA